MKTFIKISLLLIAFTAQSIAETASKETVPPAANTPVRGVLISSPYQKVYKGYLVDNKPIYRGILISSPATYVARTTYYEEENPIVDTAITLGIVGGLTALFLSADHWHGSWGWHGGHHHRGHHW